MGISITEEFFKDPTIKTLIGSTNDSFDLVIVEAFFNEAFLGFAHKFKAPVIEMSSVAGASWVWDWFANPIPFSYVPNNYLPYSDQMSLLQRLHNAFIGTFYRVARHLYYLPQQNAIMKKHFGLYKDLPTIDYIESHVSLLFVNQHFSLTTPRPFMPNVIPVGGMHFGLKKLGNLPEVSRMKI